MNFEEVRKVTIIALFSDDQLMEQLVLKGGNAINLVHRLSSRASLDLDFSLERDFSDFEDAKRRIFQALRDRFDSAGYAVFDEIWSPSQSSTVPTSGYGGVDMNSGSS